MTTLAINKGDSARIAIQIPLERVLLVDDIQVNVGNLILGKLSENTIVVDEGIANLYYVDVTSNISDKLANSKLPVIVAIDWSDLGVRKTWEANSLILWVGANRNSFSNNSNSEVVDATIDITVDDNNLVVDNKVATIFRGYDSLDLWRIQTGDLGATFDEMMFNYTSASFEPFKNYTSSLNIWTGSVSSSLDTKQQIVTSISELQSFNKNTFAYFDGSVWEKKSGNVSSNGGSYAGTLIRVDSGSYWERSVNDGRVNILWFGGRGDDVTNNIPAINAAKTYASQSGKHIYIPAGDYIITTGIVITQENSEIWFEGEWNTINGTNIHSKIADGSAAFEMGLPDGNPEDANLYNGVQGLKITGINFMAYAGPVIQLDCVINGNFRQYAIGIRDNRGGNLYIENCTFENYDKAVYMVNSDFSRMKNCTFYYNNIGLYVGARSDQGQYDANQFTFCNQAIQINQASGLVFNQTSIVECGTTNISAMKIGSTYGSTGMSQGITFNSLWFEKDASSGLVGTVPSWIQIGDVNSTITADAIVLNAPTMRNSGDGSYLMGSFINFYNSGTTTIINPRSNFTGYSIAPFLIPTGSYSPNIDCNATGYYLLNQGTGNPVFAGKQYFQGYTIQNKNIFLGVSGNGESYSGVNPAPITSIFNQANDNGGIWLSAPSTFTGVGIIAGRTSSPTEKGLFWNHVNNNFKIKTINIDYNFERGGLYLSSSLSLLAPNITGSAIGLMDVTQSPNTPSINGISIYSKSGFLTFKSINGNEYIINPSLYANLNSSQTFSASMNFSNGIVVASLLSTSSLSLNSTGVNSIIFSSQSGSSKWMQLFGNTGNLVLQNGGTFIDDSIHRLQINGYGRFNGASTITQPIISINNSVTSGINGFTQNFQALQPNLINGASMVGLSFGKSTSSKNGINLVYVHSSDNSNSNFGALSFNSVNNIITFNANSDVGINTISPSGSFHVSSTTRASIPAPIMTTSQRNALTSVTAGSQVYDSTLNQMCWYNGTNWLAVSGSIV